ncbi:hypothetical protein [Sphingobium sp. EM0848]|uniref:hypothetical protein n=1 Tax=Sphingobium sp. EM0848 TaxID=2743473 RepID=UPI00159C59D7|nr:hypothetical protein [Sphingobium sp. EM0848]
MNDLLAYAVQAHGGLDRWNAFTTLEAHLSIDGAIWDVKQQSGLLRNKHVEIDTHKERLAIVPFLQPDLRTIFVPQRLALENAEGKIIEAWDHPEGAFAGHARETPWEPLHAAYFASEALWTYLTSPFLYTYPGFESEEIEPWHENGETWRRLKVTFPDTVKSHTKTQITHFGPDGLMRRHDYVVDVLGRARGANYPSDYRAFQGIMMPTRRRVYAYDDAMRKVPDPLLVSIDFDTIRLR